MRSIRLESPVIYAREKSKNISSWGGDEYSQAFRYRSGQLDALKLRLFTWSPRPISDFVLFIYYFIVEYSKKPFIGLFLGTLSLFFGSCLYISLRKIIQNTTDHYEVEDNNFKLEIRSQDSSKSSQLYSQLISLLITLFLFIYCIFITKSTEIFYWPAGAAPYLLSLAGIVLSISSWIKMSQSKNVSFHESLKIMTFTMLTAFSSEMGALFQFIFSLFLCVIIIYSRFNKILLSVFVWNQKSIMKLLTVTSCSFALSSLVLFLLKNSRVGKSELNSLLSPITGNIKASVILATKQFLKEILLINNSSLKIDSFFASFSYSLIIKLTLLLLVIILGIQAKIYWRKSTELIAIVSIISLMTANFLIITASAYQFGEICCPRHLHFRAILIGISILLFGLFSASRLRQNWNVSNIYKTNQKYSIQYLVLTSNFSFLIITAIGLILLINLQFNSIAYDLKNYSLISISNQKNWTNNLSNPSVFGEYTNPFYPKYVYTFRMPVGTYLKIQDNLPWSIKGYMSYFNKEKLSVYPFNSQFFLNSQLPPDFNPPGKKSPINDKNSILVN